MYKILIISILLTTSGCRWFADAKGLHNLAFTNIRVPEGTPNFQKGYKDGCATVLYSRTNALYRAKYEYRFDPELIDNKEYFFGRKRGYNYCFGYSTGGSGHFGSGWDKYIYGQGTPFDMGRGNINDTIPQGKDTMPDNSGIGGFFQILTQSGGGNTVLGGHPFYGKKSMNSDRIFGW